MVSASSAGVAGSKGSYGSAAAAGSLMGNGVGNISGTNAWNANGGGQSDRWNSSSSMSMNRTLGAGASFTGSWTGAAPPMNSAVFNPAMGGMGNLGAPVMSQSGSVGYSGDRYSSRH